MLLVGVGAELCSGSFEAQVSAIIEEANPSQVAVELTTGEPDLLLRGVDELVERAVSRATFGFGSVPDEARLHNYSPLFWALGLCPQREMATAASAAAALNLPVAHVDTPMSITLAALEEALSISELTNMQGAADSAEGVALDRLAASLAAADGGLEPAVCAALRQRDQARQCVEQLRTVAPAMAGVVIDARNQALSEQLLALEGSTVAVVGVARMDGVEECLRRAGAQVG